MIKFAVIGTNWITEKFIQGTLNPPQGNKQVMQLSAVYSRELTRAQTFAAKFSVADAIIETFDDLQQLATSTNIDAVYIASPNSLHYQQSKHMLENGKHVICEKPLSSTYQEALDLYKTAKENNVIFFEAYMTAHLPNFAVIQDALPQLGQIRKAHIHYCQYSSRYPAYLEGKKPNTFDPAFSNGSIMDIGYYCVALTTALFGKPRSVKAQAILLDSGVDGCGSVLLDYGDFCVTIDHSKISASNQFSEIQGEAGSLLIKHVGQCEQIIHQDHSFQSETEVDLTKPQSDNSMSYESIAFVKQITKAEINPVFEQRSLLTAQIINEVRKQTGIVFPADKVQR
ncbi:Gfo/Idh/MocA family oxidoreductase [Psychromonas arctica]|uniref:Gfo/Idh/MocA family oxidoreductase n=1 Tax=Psychromonas arctica TaxID=168275 RepID=A0ABU9H7K1_9GAMM